jgi:hypothetical protein
MALTIWTTGLADTYGRQAWDWTLTQLISITRKNFLSINVLHFDDFDSASAATLQRIDQSLGIGSRINSGPLTDAALVPQNHRQDFLLVDCAHLFGYDEVGSVRNLHSYGYTPTLSQERYYIHAIYPRYHPRFQSLGPAPDLIHFEGNVLVTFLDDMIRKKQFVIRDAEGHKMDISTNKPPVILDHATEQEWGYISKVFSILVNL